MLKYLHSFDLFGPGGLDLEFGCGFVSQICVKGLSLPHDVEELTSTLYSC